MIQSRLPLLGSLLHVPHVPGILTNAAQWFIQRYGKLVIVALAKIITIADVITLDKSSSKAAETIQTDILGFGSLQVGLYLGPYPAVVLYDYEDARDLFNQDVVSGTLVIFHNPTILQH